MLISEITQPTIQGEGLWTGIPSVFVRVQGCPVRCKTCDTLRAWDFSSSSAREISVDSIAEIIDERARGLDVVITGGEPLDPHHIEEVVDLVREIHDRHFITVETSGSVKSSWAHLDDLCSLVDFWSVSPKLSSMKPGMIPNIRVIQQICNLGIRVQLKFVMASDSFESEIEEAAHIIRETTMLPARTDPDSVIIVIQLLTRSDYDQKEILRRYADIVKAGLRRAKTRDFVGRICASAKYTLQFHKLIGVE